MKTFKKYTKDKACGCDSCVKEDGMAGGVGVPANNVGGGAISGTGGKGGEPGVDLGKKRKVVIKSMFKRNPPKMA